MPWFSYWHCSTQGCVCKYPSGEILKYQVGSGESHLGNLLFTHQFTFSLLLFGWVVFVFVCLRIFLHISATLNLHHRSVFLHKMVSTQSLTTGQNMEKKRLCPQPQPSFPKTQVSSGGRDRKVIRAQCCEGPLQHVVFWSLCFLPPSG